MSTIHMKNLSQFGQTALSLDQDFGELERLSGQLERLSIDSDSGLDKAREILGQFGECGLRIADGVQGMAKALDEARGRAEKAAQLVSARAALVQERQILNHTMLEKFHALGERVGQVTATVAQLKKPAGHVLSAEEKEMLPMKLSELQSKLGILIEEADGLRQEAQQVNLKTLERNADSLGQSLSSARRKLSAFIEQRPEEKGAEENRDESSPQLH